MPRNITYLSPVNAYFFYSAFCFIFELVWIVSHMVFKLSNSTYAPVPVALFYEQELQCKERRCLHLSITFKHCGLAHFFSDGAQTARLWPHIMMAGVQEMALPTLKFLCFLKFMFLVVMIQFITFPLAISCLNPPRPKAVLRSVLFRGLYLESDEGCRYYFSRNCCRKAITRKL
jgi:hypothetical protein